MKRGSCGKYDRTIKKGNNECERKEMIPKFSLPIISNEKICSVDNYSVNSFQGDKASAKGPESFKVKIKCRALNVEKIIEFKSNKNTGNKILEPIKVTEKCGSREGKTAGNKKTLKATEKCTASVPVQNKSSTTSRKTSKNDKVKATVKHFKILPKGSGFKKKRKMLQDFLLTPENKYIPYDFHCTTKQTNFEEQNFQTNTSKDAQALTSTNINITSEGNISSTNLNTETPSAEGFPCFSFCILDDDSAYPELSDINLEEHLPFREICCEELKMNSEKNNEEAEKKSEKNKKTEDTLNKPKIFEIPDDFNYYRNESQSSLSQGDQTSLSKPSLQTAVETFMKNPQINYLKGSIVLKKGLCFSWLANNYTCFNEQCPYSHNALNLFTKKLKQYPSKFIMSLVASLRNDLLFVDVVLAAFKVISERKIPVVWVTFLTFFVFYVTEPSDSRFLKFWVTAARFFCELKKTYSTASGFASLLSIFSQAKDSEEWKIIEFIKLIRRPPIEVSVSFAFLQPILKLNLPPELLIEAVQSCIATQNDVLKVYSLIVPKISIATSPIEVVELLLKLCKTLEEMNHKNFAHDLKRRLRGKVLSFKTKVIHQKYPLTASFQVEISVYPNEVNCQVSGGLPKDNPETTSVIIDFEKNYFQVGEDICNVMAQQMEFSTDTIPSPYRNTEDACGRQLNRIKQFFRDCQFDLLGKYLNELKPNAVERAAEEFLKLLFRMKMSLQQGVDLIRIILLPCKSENAAKVVANICITFIVNLIRINEWEKAYTIVSLCQEKQIDLVEGKVFHSNQFNTITQCRIALLLIEIQAYKGNYTNAIDLVKKYFLFSPNTCFWRVTWKACDEAIRIRILEDLLGQIILNQFTEAAFELFGMIWKEQKHLLCSVDLRKFVNEILILLLNENREEAVTLYEELRNGGQICDTTIRAIVVNMVRHNRLSAAKGVILSHEQTAYFIPKMALSSGKIKILSFWLDEEIYIVFSTFFDLLISDKPHFKQTDFKELEVDLQETKPMNMTSLGLRPLCLSIIKSSLKDACRRIQRVLENQFNPPLKLIITPHSLKLDELSLKLHLNKRISQNSGWPI